MDDLAEGLAKLAMLLLLATAMPALGVAAALGGVAFSARDLAAPEGLPRRADVGILVASIVVPVLLLPLLWSGIAGFVDGRGTLGFYPLGAAFRGCALAFATYRRSRAGGAAKSPMALVLAVLSCLLYAAPALLYGALSL